MFIFPNPFLRHFGNFFFCLSVQPCHESLPIRGWLSNFNIQDSNHETLSEITNVKDVPNYIMSEYKDTSWNNTRLVQ